MGNKHMKQQKQENARIQRCLQSFSQLQADVRRLNVLYSKHFVKAEATAENPATPCILQFRAFTKLAKKSSLPWLWKINDNVIIVATVTPAAEVEAAQSTAGALDISGAAPVANGEKAPKPSPILTYPSYTLTIREFYTLFLYCMDNLRQLQHVRDQILKIEKPKAWKEKEDARREAIRQAAQAAAAAKRSAETPKGDGVVHSSAAAAEEEEEKKSSSIPGPGLLQTSRTTSNSALSGDVDVECSICLAVPQEDAKGAELVVLSCLHAFCPECINDWKTQSNTCPICRRELDEAQDGKGNAEDAQWILTSPDLEELKRTEHKVQTFPFGFISTRPKFPPEDNQRAIKSAGDAFSLVFGEVIDWMDQSIDRLPKDAFTPAPRKGSLKTTQNNNNNNREQQQEEEQQAEKKSPIPVAQPVASHASLNPPES
jgi:hypothetical protein